MILTERNIEALYPLTPLQEGILYHGLLEDGSGLYVQQYVATLSGRMELEIFRHAWDTVVSEHEALRTLVVFEGREDPLQLVRGTVSLPWSHEDLSRFDAGQQEAAVSAYLSADRKQGFELDQAPLHRIKTFGLSPERTRMVWTHHHIVVDGWSIGLVMQDVLDVYGQLIEGVDPQVSDERAQFRDFVRYVSGLDKEAAGSFWAGYLEGFTEPNHLDAGGLQHDTHWASSQVETSLPLSVDLVDKIERYAREHEVTLSTVMRAAWSLLVSSYSGDDDVVFGSTVSGRPHDLSGAMETVGTFINTIPVRTVIDWDEPVGTWLRRLHKDQLRLSEFDLSSLVDIQEVSGVPRGSPLFTSLLVIENIAAFEPEGSLRLSDEVYEQRSNYPLALLVFPGESIELILLHDPLRFSEEVARRMLAQFEHVVAQLVEDDRRAVSSISTMPSHEAVEILERWNPADTEREPARDVVLRIADAADQSPSTTALVGGDTEVTYEQLVERAALVADRLVAMGVAPGDRVGVLMPRVPGAIVAILGVLGVGAAYVPVDPDQPWLRVNEILDDAGARATIHDGTGDWQSAAPVLTLAHDGRPPPGEASGDPARGLSVMPGSAEDVAYVLYTSGSTGEPKGVEVTRRNLAESTAARDSVYPSSPRAFLMMSPLIFDSSVAGIYWALTTGGTLILPSPGMEQSVAHLGELISDHAVTHLLTLPSVYELLIESVDGASLSSLELAIVAGEPCPPSLVDRHHSLLPSVSMVNEYGPTEATVWATAAFLSAGDTTGPRVPIGKPTPHLRCFVLDKRLRPVPYGVTGELFVAGPSVARGYLGRPEETARRFSSIRLPEIGEVRAYRTGDRVRYSAPGVLDLVGRMDDQLKVRGRRFELGEIESVAGRHPGVKRAAARAFQRGKGGTEISLAFVAADETDLDVEGLRAFLARRLPDYLVPGHIVSLEELPFTPNGKVDRDRIPLPDSPRRGDHLEPKTSEEEFVLRSTRELLGHDRVELTDNFFEAGGHSLLSMHLIARIQRETGARISPNLVLFNSLKFVAASINPEQANLADEGPASSADSTPRRDEPIRFGRDAGLFGILHPAVVEPRADPVLICPPIGWEYYKSHWALRNLARNLSEAGHDAFRFDYAGTGDSLGEASDFSVEDWTKDIADARATLSSGAGSANQILVGLRFGGALATVSALRDSSVRQLILWDPVVSGADHLASLVEMHTRFFERQDPRSAIRQSGDELLGSPYPKRLREAMGHVDLRLLDWDVDFDVVLVASADRPEYQELVEASDGRIELEVVDDASGWDDLVTFNSALLPTAIPRRITRLAGGER